jgi:hypothetical protein
MDCSCATNSTSVPSRLRRTKPTPRPALYSSPVLLCACVCVCVCACVDVYVHALVHTPSPTLSPTDPVPRGLLTLCR